jgi:hypothetical protein
MRSGSSTTRVRYRTVEAGAATQPASTVPTPDSAAFRAARHCRATAKYPTKIGRS